MSNRPPVLSYPTYESFIYWYERWKSGKCNGEFARQHVPFKQYKWRLICRDYKNGEDISKYFPKEGK